MPWGSGAMGPGAVGQALGAALWGLSRGAAWALGSPRFPRAHAVGLALLVGLGPLLRLRAQPHSILASPHNLLEARLISSAGGWTALFLASLLVASFPLLRPRAPFLLRLIGRWLVGVAVWLSAPRLLSLVEGAAGRCVRPMAEGLLLLPHGGPAPCRAGGGQWEGPLLSRQAFSLVYCALGLGEEAGLLGRALYWGGGEEGPRSAPRDPGVPQEFGRGPRSAPRDPGVREGLWWDPGVRGGPWSAPRDPGVPQRDPGVREGPRRPGWTQEFWGDLGVLWGPRSPGGTQECPKGTQECPEGPRRPGSALNALFLLNVLLLAGWQALLGVTLTYRHDWSSNAVGGAAGWAAWLVTYGAWFRWAWPGPTN